MFFSEHLLKTSLLSSATGNYFFNVSTDAPFGVRDGSCPDGDKHWRTSIGVGIAVGVFALLLLTALPVALCVHKRVTSQRDGQRPLLADSSNDGGSDGLAASSGADGGPSAANEPPTLVFT